MYRDDPEPFSGLAVGKLRVRGTAAQRLAVRCPERHVHAAGGVVVLRARLFRAVAQQLELPGVVQNASALSAVVSPRLDVGGGPNELVTAVADDAPQRAHQASRLSQMARGGSRGTVRSSRAELLNCQYTRITACDLTCHIAGARQPARAIVGTRSADIECAHPEREGTRLLVDGKRLARPQAARRRTCGLGRPSTDRRNLVTREL